MTMVVHTWWLYLLFCIVFGLVLAIEFCCFDIPTCVAYGHKRTRWHDSIFFFNLHFELILFFLCFIALLSLNSWWWRWHFFVNARACICSHVVSCSAIIYITVHCLIVLLLIDILPEKNDANIKLYELLRGLKNVEILWLYFIQREK